MTRSLVFLSSRDTEIRDTLYIRKARPWDGGYVESFNGTLREEVMNPELSWRVAEAR